MGRHVSFAIAALLCVATLCSWAAAEQLTYGGIDQTTVRVLALGDVDVVNVQHEGERYQLAAPISGHGSGVIVKKNGLILTAAHVVKDARIIAVLAPGVEDPLPGEVVARDSTHDFALIRVGHTFDQEATLASTGAPLAVRQTVYAVGYPLDATRADPQSTRGVVSGLSQNGQLQLGISVNPGNSGGPVIDEQELVHGIVVSRSSLKAGAVGLAWAVPLSVMRGALAREMETAPGAAREARLGSDDAKALADLVSLLAHEGNSILKSSVDWDEADAKDRRDQVRGLYEALPGSPEALLLGAVFYWNRAQVHRAKKQSAVGELATARALVERAVALDSALAVSPFVEVVRGSQPSKFALESSGDDASVVRIRMESSSTEPVVFYQRPVETTSLADVDFNRTKNSRVVWARVCESPCESEIKAGAHELALSGPNSKIVWSGESVKIEEDSTLRGTYRSPAGARTLGFVLFLAGAAGGTAVLIADSDHAVAAGAMMGGGAVLWLVLASANGSATIEVLPWGTPPGEQKPPPTKSSRSSAQVSQASPGATLKLTF